MIYIYVSWYITNVLYFFYLLKTEHISDKTASVNELKYLVPFICVNV